MNVQRFESVFLEIPPWVEGRQFEEDLGFSISVPELPAALLTLPEEFRDALAEVEQNRDNTACWRCGDLVGWVFMEGPVTGRLDWVSLGLVREIHDDLPPGATMPARLMCETCTPYVDPESYRDMRRARRADREAVRTAEEENGGR